MPATKAISIITHLFPMDSSTALPLPQLRRLGLIYSSYRLVVSIFFMFIGYVSARANDSVLLPSLLQHTALAFYFILSLILLTLFYVVRTKPRRQIVFGLALDVIILSLLLYTNGAPDLQLTMLYMVVVAASFMLLPSSQALVITLLAIIFVIYQQFFYAIANSMSLSNLSDALLMSASFLAVGFLSFNISQRLVHMEQVAARQAKEVDRLNAINQEVVSQMVNGVIVIDRAQIVLVNQAAYQLLGIADIDLISDFEQQMANTHSALLNNCLAVPIGRSRSFIYELPADTPVSVTARLRVQMIPLKDTSQLIILEDLRREQAGAQQLKLASLGQLTASIAHEIRNPLAAISQASQLLMEDVEDHTPNGANLPDAEDMSGNHELYKMIFAQTKRVNRIIEDVLRLSRQQQPNRQPITLASWLPQFLEQHFSGHDVFLHLQGQPIISFDTHQLEQILINLINNGLRYSSLSHPHACVELDVHCAQNDVIIDILDDGAGVSAADYDLLFDPFFTTDKAGTGLGLYLSQAFSEANHARLLYVAEHEKTCFRLIMPINSCPAGASRECASYEHCQKTTIRKTEHK